MYKCVRIREKQDLVFKNCIENRHIWAKLAAPVVANSEKNIRISYVNRSTQKCVKLFSSQKCVKQKSYKIWLKKLAWENNKT